MSEYSRSFPESGDSGLSFSTRGTALQTVGIREQTDKAGGAVMKGPHACCQTGWNVARWWIGFLFVFCADHNTSATTQTCSWLRYSQTRTHVFVL